MLAGTWCSKFKTEYSRGCPCGYNKRLTYKWRNSDPEDIYCYSLCCFDYVDTDLKLNKNGTWCSSISSKSSTNSKVVGTLSGIDYYCHDYVETIFIPERTPAISMTIPRTYQEGEIKFNVLMSILSFILND